MSLRHLLTHGLALLLLAGLSVGISGCKPEEGADTDAAPANGEAGTEDDAGMTEDEKGLDETPEGGTDAGTETDADADAGTDASNAGDSGTTPGADDSDADAPAKAQPPAESTNPIPSPESGSATDGGDAESKIPTVPEAGSVTEIPPEKVPGTPPIPEAGSSTK